MRNAAEMQLIYDSQAHQWPKVAGGENLLGFDSIVAEIFFVPVNGKMKEIELYTEKGSVDVFASRFAEFKVDRGGGHPREARRDR